MLFALGAVGALLGAWVYHQYMRHWTFRNSLLCVQLLFAASGMLDVVLVTHVNRKLQIPDYVFAVVDEAVSSVSLPISFLIFLFIVLFSYVLPFISGTNYRKPITCSSTQGIIRFPQRCTLQSHGPQGPWYSISNPVQTCKLNSMEPPMFSSGWQAENWVPGRSSHSSA